MNKRSADLRIVAERAAQNGRTGRHHGVLNPVLPIAPGPIRSRRAGRLTAAQRNSIGRLSEWSRSPYAPKGGWQ